MHITPEREIPFAKMEVDLATPSVASVDDVRRATWGAPCLVWGADMKQ